MIEVYLAYMNVKESPKKSANLMSFPSEKFSQEATPSKCLATHKYEKKGANI